MARRGITPWVVLALVLIGTLCITLRYQSRRDERLGLSATAWRLTYSVEGEAQEESAQFRVVPPLNTALVHVFRQVVESNLRVESLRSVRDKTPEIVAHAENHDWCELAIQFDLLSAPQIGKPTVPRPVALSLLERATYLAGDEKIQIGSSAVRETLQQLRPPGIRESELPARFFQFCRTEISIAREHMPDDAEAAFGRHGATPIGAARAVTALCRASGIPARLVAGIELQPGEEIKPRVWMEAFIDGRWAPYAPYEGFARKLPPKFLAIRHGGPDIITARDMHDVEVEFSIARLPHLPQTMSRDVRQPLDVLDLTRLPLAMHGVISVILLFPLGAVVTCVYRNIVGIPTSGTFTPTLLALAFVFADWRTGIIVLIVIGVLGFGTRIILEHLQLLMVPRISIVITLVVCCIVFAISVLDYLHLTPGVQAVLLPMVILTMIIERFYVAIQEDGVSIALQHLTGTVIVGFSCYLVLRWEAVARVLLTYPETHFFTVAVLVLIGRYTGFRFLDSWRFRDVITFEHPE